MEHRFRSLFNAINKYGYYWNTKGTILGILWVHFGMLYRFIKIKFSCFIKLIKLKSLHFVSGFNNINRFQLEETILIIVECYIKKNLFKVWIKYFILFFFYTKNYVSICSQKLIQLTSKENIK